MKKTYLVLPGILVLIVFVSFFSGCSDSRSQEREAITFFEPFSDVLDVSGWPESKRDISVSSFSDLGSWHSYAIPDKPTGAFVGPFIMSLDNGTWFGPLADMRISIDGTGVRYDNAVNFRSVYYPGRLCQYFEAEPLMIEQKLIFISSATALIQTTIVNTSEKVVSLKLEWHGNTWLEDTKASLFNEKGIIYHLPNNQRLIVQPSLDVNVSIDSGRYLMTTTKHQLQSRGSISFGITHTLQMGQELEDEQQLITQVLASPETYFQKNEERWKGYVSAVTTGLQDSARRLVAVKALETLTNNWRSASGELKHQGFFPSYAYRGFYGFWSWDSWKHAVAAVLFDPELAKDQIRAMYDYQDSKGMIADCIFRDTTIEAHNWRDTKPPLSGWAIYEVFKATKDTAFVQEMYPRLEKYHRWWYTYRDHDGNGLCEYGSTDGTRIAAAWESGMDNAVRFDSAALRKNAEGAWSFDQESVDLNAYLYAEKIYMAKLAEAINLPADILKKESKELRHQINRTFYDPESGYYYDVKLGTQSIIRIKGPEGWIPLWAGVATHEQAAVVLGHMVDTTVFNTYVPFPTLDASHPKLNPKKGYWRGPVWLDQAYFAISGLRRYGFVSEADILEDKLLHHAEGIWEKGQPIHENYHPLSGEGLNAQHFSWSAAHLLLMLKEEI